VTAFGLFFFFSDTATVVIAVGVGDMTKKMATARSLVSLFAMFFINAVKAFQLLLT
jgi:hypothetical protein